MDAATVQTEMARAEALLKGLAGETIDTLSVNSIEAEDAPFLGLIVSKLSPMIGNLIERRVIQLLDEAAPPGIHWRRQDPEFPDAALFDETGQSAQAGFEIKAWYALSTELTGRFRESQNLLAGKNVKVVIVAWKMSHVVYGTPEVLDVLVVDAAQVAASRDNHYHKPPDYLIVEPEDTTARTRNLQQTNVAGYKWQETDEAKAKEARLQVLAGPRDPSVPHGAVEQALAQALMNAYKYRLDTNFAKVDRIDDATIEAFKTRVLAMRSRNRDMKQWAKLLKELNSDNAAVSAWAATVIQAVYDEL